MPAISGKEVQDEDFPVSLGEMHDDGGWYSAPSLEPNGTPFPSQQLVKADPNTLKASGAQSWTDPGERVYLLAKLFEPEHTSPAPVHRGPDAACRLRGPGHQLAGPTYRTSMSQPARRALVRSGRQRRQRRKAFAVLAAPLVAGVIVTGCGGSTNGGTAAESGHGDDQIQDTARGIFAAAGLSDRMLVGAYHSDDNQTGCAQQFGISTPDAWSARRSYSVEARPGPAVDRPAAYDRAVQHLRSSGWAVREYEGPFGGAPAFRADQKDAFVLYFGEDGTFTVTVGPCSTILPSLHEPTWHVVPHGRFTTPNPPKPPIRTPTPGGSAG